MYDTPTLKTLTDEMHLDLIIKPDGELWLFHNQEIKDELEWAEYDAESLTLNLITLDGGIISSGLEIPPLIDTYLRNSKTLNLGYVHDGKIVGQIAVTIIIRSV